MEALLVKPLAEVKELELDPILEKGSLRTAKSLIANPTGKQFEYFLELYLDVMKVASVSGFITIPANSSKNVDFTLRMPLTEETYHVYLDAYVGTKLLVHYKATEDVTLQALKAYYCSICFEGFDTGRECVGHVLLEHPEAVEFIHITWV